MLLTFATSVLESTAVERKLLSIKDVEMVDKLPELPGIARYVQALTVIEDQISEKQRNLLVAHWSSPKHVNTATKLARALGWSGYRAVNLQYGRLGKLLRNEMDYTAPGAQSYVISSFSKRTNGDWRLHMHEEMASALEQLGWVSKKTEPSETHRSRGPKRPDGNLGKT
jgi:hypothetical protein